MCNSVEVVKKKCRSGKCLIGLTHCPHLPDLLSDRQERDFDNSAFVHIKHQNTRKPNPDKDISNHVPYIE
jgi:hypothetical protein